jgi:hypothetical protein
MSYRYGFAALGTIVLGVLLAGVNGPASADEEKKKEGPTAAASPAGEDVANVAMAYRLAEYGRKHKEPEMLVSAARILRHIKATPGNGKPTKIEAPKDAKAPEDEPAESPALGDEAKKLLEEAKKMAPDDAALTELIERAGKEKTRGSLGGPRSFTRALGPGFTHFWGVNFVGGRPASVSVTGNGFAVFTVEAVNDDGVTVASSTGLYPSLYWYPAFTRHFTIRVRNEGEGGSRYTLYHN